MATADMYVIRHIKSGAYWTARTGNWVWNRQHATVYTLGALREEPFPDGGVARHYITDEPVIVRKGAVAELADRAAGTLYDMVEKVQGTGRWCTHCKHLGNCETGRHYAGTAERCNLYELNISPAKAPREQPGLLGRDAFASRIHDVECDYSACCGSHAEVEPHEDWVPLFTTDDIQRAHGMGVEL